MDAFSFSRKIKAHNYPKKYSQLTLFFKDKLDLTGFENTIGHAKFR